jgi:hypothetical protein
MAAIELVVLPRALTPLAREREESRENIPAAPRPSLR